MRLPLTGGTAPAWWVLAIAFGAVGAGVLALVIARARRRSHSS